MQKIRYGFYKYLNMSRTRKDESLMSIMGLGFIQFEFHLIEDYMNHMETHFERELKSIESEYEKFHKSKEDKSEYSEEYLNHVQDSFIDDIFMFNDVYIKNYRNAQIIQLYSFLEDVLKRGCDRFAHYKKTDYKVDDLKGNNDIDKIKKFLKQSAKVDFSLLNPEWKFMDDFRQVRNLIVHHKGLIKNNDTVNNSDKKFNSIKNFSKGRFMLKNYASSDYKFEIVFDNPSFFKEVIRNIESLLEKIGKTAIS
ncbi:MAG: hypothetical protein CL596_02480 [Alteromonas sp.]|jgi:hypothetical protein|nr:hypothetical protein [Alteromonas sp.]MAY22856.1 hypothetical protein [Flavobacteriaceae bacterium]|tara:strand:+ start:912 stop:1667 length:756 start_codon:yes stop_codon:yes gene_type:complete